MNSILKTVCAWSAVIIPVGALVIGNANMEAGAEASLQIEESACKAAMNCSEIPGPDTKAACLESYSRTAGKTCEEILGRVGVLSVSPQKVQAACEKLYREILR